MYYISLIINFKYQINCYNLVSGKLQINIYVYIYIYIYIYI